jgi:predicted RNase H-like HicB family nuclease
VNDLNIEKCFISDEGYSVSCPTLQGFWSQGETEEEALENIKTAIEEYLEVLK